MFEILKALLDMKSACDQHDHGFFWEVDTHTSATATLRVEVPLTTGDCEFIEQFRELVGPR